MYREGERDTTGRYTHIFLLFYMYRERERYYLQIHTHTLYYSICIEILKSQCHSAFVVCLVLHCISVPQTLLYIHSYTHTYMSVFRNLQCIVLYCISVPQTLLYYRHCFTTDTTLLQTLLYYRHYFTTDTTLLQTLLYYRHYFTTDTTLLQTLLY